MLSVSLTLDVDLVMFSLGKCRQLVSPLWTVCRRIKPSYAWHQCQSCSPYASFTETRLSLSLHRKLATSANNNTTSECDINDKTTNTNKRWAGAQGKFQKKLHNRVFTEEERAQNEQFKQSILASRTEDEAFGTLQQKGRRGKVLSSKQTESAPALDSGLEVNTQRGALTESTAERRHAHRNSDTPRDSFTKSSKAAKFADKSRRAWHNDEWGDKFGTLQEDELGDRIQESLSTTVGSHEER